MEINEIISALKLEPLDQEGGYYNEAYCSKERISGESLPERYEQREHPFGTAIYYLLSREHCAFSKLHRLATDEIYHFYLGDPLDIILLYPDGTYRAVTLGQDISAGQHVQVVVPRGVWQGLHLRPNSKFALMGTTMAPGFIWQDFELGNRKSLLEQYPDMENWITTLTNP